MNTDGTNPVQITATADAKDFLDWSADGSKVTYTSNSQIATALVLNDGGFRYVPAAGYSGADSFTFAAYDGLVTSNTGTAAIAVNGFPTVATSASATPNHVAATTTALSVLGADDGGESNLTYTWGTTGTPPAGVSFSSNGTNSSKSTVATFTKAGTYALQATITDAGGLSTTSTVTVVVNQTSTQLIVSPTASAVAANTLQQFIATLEDQFGDPMVPQPNSNWSLSGAGSISNTGLYLAPAAPGNAIVTASNGHFSTGTSLTITAPGPVNVPSGGETLVNTASTGGTQQLPAVAMSASGNFVVVWEDGAGGGEVNAQMYSAARSPVGTQFQANTAAAGGNSRPSVAMNASGQFVVTWNDHGNNVYAQFYNTAGTAQGGNVLVTSQRQGNADSTVAMAADGSFAVAYEGNQAADNDGIYFQKFSSSGLASGSPVLVNTTTQGGQTNPWISVNPQGGYLLAWTDKSAGSKVKAAFVSNAGVVSNEFLVGTAGNDAEDNASLGVSSTGAFVVSWVETGSTAGVYSRRYNPVGTPLDTNPVPVFSTNINNQTQPVITVRTDGSYVVSWTAGGNQDGNGNGVFAQAFNPDGTADGDPFLVNTTTQGDQQDAADVWQGANLLIAWDGQGAADNNGVFFQEFATPYSGPSVATPASASPDPVTVTSTALSVLALMATANLP